MSNKSRVRIALAGFSDPFPDWAFHLEQHFGDRYDFEHFTAQNTYVSRLTDLQIALIFVQDGPQYTYWTATSKSSPATRRIPVILIAEDKPADRLHSGVDVILTPQELITGAEGIITAYARVPAPETLAQLDCECDEPLPPLAQQGVEKFNAGEFYKQHDLFEELWMQTEGPVRDLYRAILQVGVAYYQIQRGNHRGARKMLLRSVQWLTVLPDTCQGVDVKALREDSYRVRASLDALPEGEIDQFDLALLQPVKRISA